MEINMTIEEEITRMCVYPHPEIHRGIITIDINTHISPCRIDLTGSIDIGQYCVISRGVQIFTHDHYHEGRDKPLLLLQQEKGVKWQDKVIGNDVWLHECIILMQVTEIPDGVVIGAGSVVTKNPGPYEIWAGNPAIKIGER